MTSDDQPPTLTERQHAAALALVRSGSYATAARAGACSERTLRRWRTRPDFRAVVTEASRAAADDARHVLASLQLRAAHTLARAMRDDNPHVRVRAARAVLETATRLADQDLTERLEALETRMTGGRSSWPAA